jgi:hypothetical protein
MPRINDQILDSILYLYPSVEDAKSGEKVGGAGFLVSVRSKERLWIYAVTNNHVIQEAGASVIRLNVRAGGMDIIPLAINHWKPHPDGDDLAVAQLGSINPAIHQIIVIPSSTFITHEVIKQFRIGPGDDVYMVGRFVHHEGKYRNKPSVRSGIIGLMPDPDEGVQFYEGGFEQEAFLVEMRSLSGFSGSPVFFRMPLLSFEIISRDRDLKPEAREINPGPWLLGIDCGNFKIYDKVYEAEARGKEKVYRKTPYEAKTHTGYSIVIPAWKLQDLLNIEEFTMVREKRDNEIAEAKQRTLVELDAQKPDEIEGVTSEVFEEALRRASRKISRPDEEEKEL